MILCEDCNPVYRVKEWKAAVVVQYLEDGLEEEVQWSQLITLQSKSGKKKKSGKKRKGRTRETN